MDNNELKTESKTESKTEEIIFNCECGHGWKIQAPIIIEEEPITIIGMFDDVCPKCGSQCDPCD